MKQTTKQQVSAHMALSSSPLVKKTTLEQQAQRGDKVASEEMPRIQAIAGEGLRVFIDLLPVISLLWGFLLLRIIAIDESLPYFVDELRHIERGRVIWSFTDVHVSTTPGKFLLYYWLGLFDVPEALPGWLARTPVALFSMLGAAATYAVTRIFFGRRAGWLALALLAVFPFMVFYERLALSDPVAASLVIVVVWWGLVLARQPTVKNGLVLGMLINLMIAAKLIAAPAMVAPIGILLLVGPRHIVFSRAILPQLHDLWHIYKRALVVTFLLVGVVWGAIMSFYQLRQLTTPDETSPIVDEYLYEGAVKNLNITEDTTGDQRPHILFNIDRVMDALRYLWGPVLLAFVAASLVVYIWRDWRVMVLLLAGIGSVWGAIIFAAGQLSTRYLTIAGHLWVVLIVGGAVLMRDELHQRLPEHSRWQWLSWVPVGVLLAWMLVYGGSFVWTLTMDDAIKLDMPKRDTYEYFRNQTGYALQESLEDVADYPVISEGAELPIVYGLVRNCHFLPTYISADTEIDIKCSPQYKDWPGRDWPKSPERYIDIEALVAQYGAIYLIKEEFSGSRAMVDPARMNARLQWVATYERPHDGIPVGLYIVLPGSPPISGARIAAPE